MRNPSSKIWDFEILSVLILLREYPSCAKLHIPMETCHYFGPLEGTLTELTEVNQHGSTKGQSLEKVTFLTVDYHSSTISYSRIQIHWQ